MPYKTIDDLPDAVKDALPAAAQAIFLNAFNSAFEKDKDEKAANQTAWAAVKNAGFKKDEASGKWKKFDKDPVVHEFDAEIFSVGTWNGDKYTEADLDDIVKSFSALSDNVKPPLKLGHKHSGFGKPAAVSLGWVSALKRAGNKLIATFKQVPDVVYRAIKSGRYKRVSSEIYWNYKQGEKMFRRVLAGVALLGADVPAVNNLADLEAYLNQTIDGSFDSCKAYDFDTDETGKIKIEKDKGENKMSDQEKKELQEKIDAANADKKKAEDALKDNQKKQFEKDKAENLEKFKAFCEAQVKGGKMTPAARDILIKTDEYAYSEEKGFAVPFETLQKVFESQSKLIDFKEFAEDDKDKKKKKRSESAGVQVDRLANEYMEKNKGVDYAVAVAVVLNENEDLAKEYDNENVKESDED